MRLYYDFVTYFFSQSLENQFNSWPLCLQVPPLVHFPHCFLLSFFLLFSFLFFSFFFFFGNRVSLYSPGCPGIHFVDQAGLRNPPASALKACATTALRVSCFQCLLHLLISYILSFKFYSITLDHEPTSLPFPSTLSPLYYKKACS
jgi:hypothetical protein